MFMMLIIIGLGIIGIVLIVEMLSPKENTQTSNKIQNNSNENLVPINKTTLSNNVISFSENNGMNKFCNGCGTLLELNSLFCSNCGKKIR